MREIQILIALSLLTIAVPADAGFGKVDEDTYRCTVTAGGGETDEALPNLALDTAVSPVPPPERVALGGCQATPGPADSGVTTSVDAADGCQPYADVDPDTPGAEQPIQEGQPVKEGTAIWFYCDAGVTQAENAITIDFSA